MINIEDHWKDAVKFHGHSCPGLAMGVRAALIAMERLGVERDRDEELAAIAETDACGVDGIQVVTGCTLGKGNLFIKDYGKQAFTVARRQKSAYRVLFRPLPLTENQKELRERVLRGKAAGEEQLAFKKMQDGLTAFLLEAPEEKICKVEEINIELPPKARIFKSICCEECGEYFMEPRARVKNGNIVCLSCFEDYQRPLAFK